MATLRPLDTILADGSCARVGTFRCHIEDPRFTDTGPIQHFVVFFPRASVWIQHEGSRPFVADLQLATIYNRGQAYRRSPIDTDGDRGEWFALEEGVVREIVFRFDRRAAKDRERPYRFESAPVGTSLFMRQRRLVRGLSGGNASPLQFEEEVIEVVSAVLAGAYRAKGQLPRVDSLAGARQEALVARAKEVLLRRGDANVSVMQLATEIGISPFHLCRVFRKHTGLSLHAYRVQHRLRASVERVLSRGEPLSRIAADLGFSSHAHFTATFRREWHQTPSQLQQGFSARSASSRRLGRDAQRTGPRVPRRCTQLLTPSRPWPSPPSPR